MIEASVCRSIFEAARALTKEGFEMMVNCTDNPLAAKRLEDMGCFAIMPPGAPIDLDSVCRTR